MSKQTITKQVEAVVCEFCSKEIDTQGDNYCAHHVKVYKGSVVNGHKYKAVHYLFCWYRQREQKQEYVQYDFHASCFDQLMQEFLANKTTVRVSAALDGEKE